MSKFKKSATKVTFKSTMSKKFSANMTDENISIKTHNTPTTHSYQQTSKKISLA